MVTKHEIAEYYSDPAVRRNIASAQDDHNTPKVFKTQADAMKAYNDGKIGLGTRVKITEKK